MKFLVHFQYFKESGKHYSDDELMIEHEGDIHKALFATVEDARKRVQGEDWPGLTPGHHDLHTVITVYDEPKDTSYSNAAYVLMIPVNREGEMTKRSVSLPRSSEVTGH